MQRIILTALLMLASTCVSLAQTPVDYPKNEFFVGYSYHSADINTLTIDPDRKGQNGVIFPTPETYDQTSDWSPTCLHTFTETLAAPAPVHLPVSEISTFWLVAFNSSRGIVAAFNRSLMP